MLSCHLGEVWYYLERSQLFLQHHITLSNTHPLNTKSLILMFFNYVTLMAIKILIRIDDVGILTCTTLSNMCASGRNEMDTSDVTGMKTLWRNMGLPFNTETYSIEDLERSFITVKYCTSKTLTTPAASETTFSWVSMAPFGSPEAKHSGIRAHAHVALPQNTRGGTTI